MVRNLAFKADKPLNIFSKYNGAIVASFFIISHTREEKTKVDRLDIFTFEVPGRYRTRIQAVMNNSEIAVMLHSLFYEAEQLVITWNKNIVPLSVRRGNMFIALIKTVALSSKQMAGVLNWTGNYLQLVRMLHLRHFYLLWVTETDRKLLIVNILPGKGVQSYTTCQASEILNASISKYNQTYTQEQQHTSFT